MPNNRKLFGDSDSDGEKDDFRTDNKYAEVYNSWRQKEELHKLQAKYGESAALDQLRLSNEDSSSSSEDEEEPVALTAEFERHFYKTLSCLKSKDPSIYDGKVRFFDDRPIEVGGRKADKGSEGSMFLKDYERKVILERDGKYSDSEDADEGNWRSHSPTYVEEQRQIRDSIRRALQESDDHKDEGWGGMFKKREKTQAELQREEQDYLQWLAGQKEDIADKETAKSLKPLKDFWTDPKLGESDKFLRDYILKKRFLEEESKSHVPTYDEIVHDSDVDLSEDEQEIERQEEFEHKYNFRFEEPDQEFIKRYPRTVDTSMRTKDTRRSEKRKEVKERKEKEKVAKREELKRLKELKRKEIQEKIEKLKEITGNTDMGFVDNDIDGDFDPNEHDRRMQELFSNEFYQGEEGDNKPRFPEIDEEYGLLDWQKEETNREAHCEDEGFNMDCDYDPKAVKAEPESSSKSRKRNKRTKSGRQVGDVPKAEEKQKIVEDELHKMDYEDIIGDLACRFKYQETEPNNYGLTTEEILIASDKDLNKWCSLKKVTGYKPLQSEKHDMLAYKQKGMNEAFKRKIMPSLFVDPEEEEETSKTAETSATPAKKRKIEGKTATTKAAPEARDGNKRRKKNAKSTPKNQTGKDLKKKPDSKDNLNEQSLTDERFKAYGIKPKRYWNKLKYKKM